MLQGRALVFAALLAVSRWEMGSAEAMDEYLKSLPYETQIVSPHYSFIGYPHADNLCQLGIDELLSKIMMTDEEITISLNNGSNNVTLTDLRKLVQSALYSTDRPVDQLHSLVVTMAVVVNTPVIGDAVEKSLDSQGQAAVELLRSNQGVFASLGNAVNQLISKVNLQTVLQETTEALETAVETTDEGEKVVEGVESCSGSGESVCSVLGSGASPLDVGDDGRLVCPCDCDSVSCDCTRRQIAKACDCCSATNSIDDTVVGFTGSRTFSNLLTALVSDVFQEGLVHSATYRSLGDAACEGFMAGNYEDVDSTWATCGLSNLMLWIISCAVGVETANCTEVYKGPTYIEYEQCELLTPHMDADGVAELDAGTWTDSIDPETHYVKNSMENAEGLTMLWLAQGWYFDSVLQKHCMVAADKADFITEYLPGWKPVFEVWVTSEVSEYFVNLTIKDSPYTSVSRKSIKRLTEQDGSCEFLITTRGSITDWDWYINVGFAQVVLPGFSAEYKGHEGYVKTAWPIAEAIISYLDNYHFNNQDDELARCDPAQTKIYLSGHSLGGGITNMLTLKLAHHYKPLQPDLKFSSASFASLRVFNQVASDYAASLADIRNYRYQYDLVPSIPCTNTGFQRCSSLGLPAVPGLGLDEPYAENPNYGVLRGYENFAKQDSRLSFFEDTTFMNFPNLGTSTLDLLINMIGSICSTYVNIPIPLQFNAGHSCSYGCHFTRYGCSTDITKQECCVRRVNTTIDVSSNCMIYPEDYDSEPYNKLCTDGWNGTGIPWTYSGSTAAMPASIDCKLDENLLSSTRVACDLQKGITGLSLWRIMVNLLQQQGILTDDMCDLASSLFGSDLCDI